MLRPKANRLEDLTVRLTTMLGDQALAHRWLHTPRESLGGETPAELLRTEAGTFAVEALLARAEHGVFY